MSLIALANKLVEKYPEIEKIGADNATAVGAYLANVARFTLARIPENQRRSAIHNLIGKLRILDRNELSRKKLPAFASLGQVIVLTKSAMYGQHPAYIDQVINSMVSHLLA